MSYLDPGGKSGAMEGDRCNRKAVYKPYCDRFHHKLIQQLWNNSSRPLGLVVKRITSMTYKSANDKIARSIRAEGIPFYRGSFCWRHRVHDTSSTNIRHQKAKVNFWVTAIIIPNDWPVAVVVHTLSEYRISVNSTCTKKVFIMFTRSLRSGFVCKRSA